MARSFTKGLINWLLRSLLVLGKQPRWSKAAGFVLPTTVLLLLVITLTVGAIGFRTFTRTQQTIGERQQRVIYNAATPAIDRAKAKLEFLFDVNRDSRGGVVPPENTLVHMMLNDGAGGVSKHSSGIDPYTFKEGSADKDEQRIDINGDGVVDNAWKYKADTNGDGTVDATIAYSIIFKAPLNQQELLDTRDDVANKGVLKRAPNLEIRNTPLSNATQLTDRCRTQSGVNNGVPLTNGEGWFKDPINTTILRKNFQVDVYVLPTNPDGTPNPNGAIATLEFQQDRQANQGFKWAAWFRNDLEVFPGPQFNWNGAMHTEGSYFFTGNFRGYMISSVASCLYTKDASEITAAETPAIPEDGINAFQGQFIAGSLRDNDFNGTTRFDLWNGANVLPATNPTELTSRTDSVTEGSLRPLDFALDPVKLHTRDVSESRNITASNPDGNPSVTRDLGWKNRPLNQKERMINQVQETPYVDDTFRADNRWGPRPRWGLERKPVPPGEMGKEIGGTYPELTGNDPTAGGDSTEVGLDGYWERRARREGLRLIVGQRLELGDVAGWGGPGPATPGDTSPSTYRLMSRGKPFVDNEPLRPWMGTSASNARYNETRQRRTLWDNLASVQSTAVYHSNYGTDGSRDFPLACIATTVHPGTSGTLDRSSTFENLAYGLTSNVIRNTNLTTPINYSDQTRPLIISDFFRGRGTNGWEYAPPPEDAFRQPNTDLRTALKNLAQFAGDPNGGTPSFSPPSNQLYTPYPLMSMWGDFSTLRRVIRLLDTQSGGYDSLSPADKTTLHTAGCTLGMLAYNLDYLEKLPRVRGTTDTPPSTTPDLNALTLDGRLGKTEAEKLLGIPGLALKPNPTGSISAGNLEASKGLRGYIRLINAAIDNKTPDGTTIPDNDRNFTNAKVPNEILLLGGANGTAVMDTMARLRTGSNNPETYVRLMERWRDRLAPGDERENLNKAIYLAQLLITREQVARDRTFGFLGAYGSVDSGTDYLAKAPLGQCSDWWRGATDADKDDLRFLCSARPRFPILYSLFPAREPLVPSTETSLDAWYTNNIFRNHGDIDSEFADSQFKLVRGETDGFDEYLKITANRGVEYKVVKPETVATLPRGVQSMGSAEAWRLPSVVSGTGVTPNSNRLELIKVCATSPCSLPATGNTGGRPAPVSASLLRIPFKDTALFNGRELLSVRALDLDLDLMRTSATPAGDLWLPKSGIIYAFREDAVSEAHISRPKLGTLESCVTAGQIQDNDNCQMRTRDGFANNFDPPTSDSGVTSKPVDFFPDPDRRPNGFRLRNGETVQRDGDDGVGLSFITDNPAYVQGPFNLHQASGATQTPPGSGLEEFLGTDKLALDFSNFYTRENLDQTEFSKKANDRWRPSEVLADAVTPLSLNFCDGSMEDSFMVGDNGTPASVRERYGCTISGTGGASTSYRNQPRIPTQEISTPNALNKVKWMRSNIVDSLWLATYTNNTDKPVQGESPIIIHPNGNPMQIEGGAYAGAYADINGNRDLINAVNTQMNMIMVSGVVPSRLGQSYGGLHNFPRFIESWAGTSLFMSGAFLQLNFSTYATAPFDQQNWQRGEAAPTPGAGNDNEWIRYYAPPNRFWGYDVGLQYTAAGPVARRFRFSLPTRSEFYSEPAATDPYIKNLCKSIRTPADCS
jgi:hypothetical protein